jgi:acyl carrier protein
MNEGLEPLIRRLLSDIAPDIDFAALDADADIRDAADLDSVDFLNFVSALFEETGVDVPERDYPAIRSIAGCRQYLAERMPA